MPKSTFIERFNRHHPFNAALAITLYDDPEKARVLGMKIGHSGRVTANSLGNYLKCCGY